MLIPIEIFYLKEQSSRGFLHIYHSRFSSNPWWLSVYFPYTNASKQDLADTKTENCETKNKYGKTYHRQQGNTLRHPRRSHRRGLWILNLALAPNSTTHI